MQETLEQKVAKQLTTEQQRIIKIGRYVSPIIDIYDASGPILGAAAAGLGLTGVGAPIAAALVGITAFTEAADIITGPLTGVYIQAMYGEGAIGIAEALTSIIPFVGDLFPGASLAHNLYLDRLRNEGYEIADSLYILPGVWKGARSLVDNLVPGPGKAHGGVAGNAQQEVGYATIGDKLKYAAQNLSEMFSPKQPTYAQAAI